MNLNGLIIRKKGSWDKFKISDTCGTYYRVDPYFHGSVLSGAAQSGYIKKSTPVKIYGNKMVFDRLDGTFIWYCLGMYSEKRAKLDKKKYMARLREQASPAF